MKKPYIKVNLSPADKATIQSAADEDRMSDSQFLLLAGLEKAASVMCAKRVMDAFIEKESDNG